MITHQPIAAFWPFRPRTCQCGARLVNERCPEVREPKPGPPRGTGPLVRVAVAYLITAGLLVAMVVLAFAWAVVWPA